MPKLITEILRDIFIQLLGNDLENAKHIERFMLSGKKAFDVALKFFSTAKRVTVIENDFLVLFPSGHHLVMLYDCVLLKSILKAIALSVELIEFRKRPVGAGEDIVYEILINEGLKSVYFYTGHDVPANYLDKIRNLASLENASFEEKIMSISNLSIIRPPCSEVFLTIDFAEIISMNIDNTCFPHLENLDIIGDFNCTTDNPNSIPQVITKIFKIFPNLKILKASFGNLVKRKVDVHYSRFEPSLKLLLETAELVNREMFAGIPKHVKGVFTFQCLTDKIDVESVTEKYADKEGYRVTDYFIEKHFNFHQNMEFSFYSTFKNSDIFGSEDSDMSASDDDAESDSDDDYDIEMESDDEDGQVVAMNH